VPLRVGAGSADKDLEGIKQKIEREKQGLSRVQKQEGSVLQLLGKIESDLDNRTKELKLASAKFDAIVVELEKKEKEATQLSSSVRARQELLQKRALALYRWQRSGSPFVLLNGEISPGSLMQRKRYLEKTISFDRELIEKLSLEAQQQEAIRQDLLRKREAVEGQKRTLADAQEAVAKEAAKKKQLLASLQREKQTRVRAVKELEQAALRLQKMLEEITRRSGSKPQEAPAGVGLETMRGKLDWPVKGAVTGGFGKSLHPEFAAEVFRKGIDIEAPAGEEIKAVEKGRVVYADRFAGYGKMVIIDHGERFYTIYAHLAEILKKNGDGVKRGETVGLVGDSDSLAGVKLYFEMRKDGRSVDPLPWFRKQ
jgi:septal ring factor EnvC (AmiA/AmiB activator)